MAITITIVAASSVSTAVTIPTTTVATTMTTATTATTTFATTAADTAPRYAQATEIAGGLTQTQELPAVDRARDQLRFRAE